MELGGIRNVERNTIIQKPGHGIRNRREIFNMDRKKSRLVNINSWYLSFAEYKILKVLL